MDEELLGPLEALLFLAASPQTPQSLADALGIREEDTLALLHKLSEEYTRGRQRGFYLKEAGGGWRFYTHPRYADIITAHVTARQSGKLSQAALETLAVIAYKQPVTRAQVAAIRGVNVDGVVRTLLTRGLIEETGEGATGAILYGTTPFFLEAMGMNSLNELPPLAPYLPEADELDDVEKEIR
ncbi:SMC-Scp complex subunit ScpB [Actinotignum urinale]|uniref:SMC-Scp complex subunit ScpB n=1 Tax=Actinotignum urinale TaxID=190146 RepID=A0AAW9HVV5_9ACTO|nr:SMC-Scp complex subunit ScpB [Actinotignum urinale]MDY5128820.1 SMC-Scp complex subunit ScpB [Actinotignum urinale]MDY5152137.1 SMC-Scp complex subunit ScpB [Actinotignum urinale]MDY5154555.1 SMC-Scp complex subunit ScpB [Actinotignum urinale]MDY5160242.1 SMC-Scp complex subunit ScpB [Actinotignum urinale]WIK59846.1 SMC-Scp complex subunit ScpB [Actinotignum urinale]